MQKGIVIGFLISLAIVISLGLFFTFTSRNLYLAQITSSLEKFEELNSEIQNLKRELSILKETLEEKNKEDIKEKVLSSSQSQVLETEEPEEIVICQKIEKDFARHRVIFNEICWMGDEESPANEWIEIKNISQEEIDLSGWQILNKNQKIKIIFEEGTKILPNEILLLKRGDDFSGAIKNSDEALFLFDKDCNLEDEVFAEENWPAGDNFSKRTMERKSDLSWQTSLNPGGTPGKENSSGFVESEKEEEKEPKISLSFPKEVFSNQEFKVSLLVSDLENETYDVKISILKISDESEQKRTISEISLTGEEWQSSYKYLTKVFSGTSFSGDFKLRISSKYQDFEGQAEILAKVRQSDNKRIVAEFKDKIKVKESAPIPIPTEFPPSIETQPPKEVKNLLLNFSFEEEGEKPELAVYWRQDPTASATVRSEEIAKSGNWSMKQKDITTSYARELISSPFRVKPGESYKFGGWYYLINPRESIEPTIYRAFIQICWLTGNENEIGCYPSQGEKLTVFENWTIIEFQKETPSNAAYAQLRVRIKRDSGTPKTDIYWDDMFVIGP